MTIINGNSPSDTTPAFLRFVVPDLSVPPEDCALYAGPANKHAENQKLLLHNARNASNLASGGAGLDAQGFTFVHHQSALKTPEDFYSEPNIRDIYMGEVEKLMCELTGAKQVVIINAGLRRKLAAEQEDLGFYNKRGSDLDIAISKTPRDIKGVVGCDKETAPEPARFVHVDLTPEGLRRGVRYTREDVRAAAQPAIDAEDMGAIEVPRYACYSVWRPIKTIRRDPISVCDYRTIEPDTDLEKFSFRSLSGVLPEGEFKMEASAMLPPPRQISSEDNADVAAKTAKHKWYWFPEQTPQDLLVIKLSDSESTKNPAVAGGTPHGAPALVDVDESLEPRESIEVRVFAFW